jgi:hypothetical protein
MGKGKGKGTAVPAVVGAVIAALALTSCAAPASSSSAGSPASSTPPASPRPAAPAAPAPEAPSAVPAPPPSPSAVAPTNPWAVRALEVIDTVSVKGRAPATGYSRDQFGDGWLDPDGNGCDTRNDILARDLTGITMKDRCKVATGTLADPYSGRTIAFVRGQDTSALVQIDHVVALSNAWQTGAQQLSAAQREAFGNDPLNLLAVDGGLNQAKGAGDAATWLPPNKAVRCEYVARQTLVKHKYGLWFTAAEKDAVVRELSRC